MTEARLDALQRTINHPRTLVIPRLDGAPQMDGRLEEAYWQRAAPADTFLRQGPLLQETRRHTTAYLGRDDAYLYIAFRCADACLEPLQQAHKPEDIFENEFVALLLRPVATSPVCYQIVVDPLGQVSAQCREMPPGSENEGQPVGMDPTGFSASRPPLAQLAASIQAQVTVACTRGDGEWATEMRIPLAALGIATWDGAWGINLYRGTLPCLHREFSSWSRTLTAPGYSTPQLDANYLGQTVFAPDGGVAAAEAGFKAALGEALQIVGAYQAKARLSGKTIARAFWAQQMVELTPGPHLFTDWRYVNAGAVLYQDANGQIVPLRGSGPFFEAYGVPHGVPYGVRIQAERAHLERLDPFPDNQFPVQVIRDGGKYRMYCTGPQEPRNVVRMLESDDGSRWTAPRLGIVEVDGSRDNNIVLGPDIIRHTGTPHGPAVFRDPSASAAERYKMVFNASGPRDPATVQRLVQTYWQTRPNDIDPLAVKFGSTMMFGAVSPDGLRWELLPEPQLLHYSDTSQTAYYDTVLEKYVWYGRCNWWGAATRRCIGRAETNDFRYWPTPEMVVWPRVDMAPSDDWYLNSKTLYPGTTQEHLMFPTLYHRAADVTEVELMSSADGIYWEWVPGGPVVPLARGVRTPGSGGMWMGKDLVELPGERVGVMCGEALYPHKYPRRGDVLASQRHAWAWWPKERLAAVVADEQGEFETMPLLTNGRRVRLNVETRVTGQVEVEVCRITNAVWTAIALYTAAPIPGRSFADCDPIAADDCDRIVTWRGESDIGTVANEPVVLRFRLRAAELFAFEVL